MVDEAAPRLRIVRGSASPEEVAAVVTALTAAAVARTETPATTASSGWASAARLEGVGARLVTSRADLNAP